MDKWDKIQIRSAVSTGKMWVSRAEDDFSNCILNEEIKQLST
jgi:hypothetical protein